MLNRSASLAMSTSVLKALPGKLDIKRHSPSILYFHCRTKETLASGHFMSVINILMQLRKVCNHPSLFDPRPIVSPLQMEGLVYHTASMVLNALKYDPLEVYYNTQYFISPLFRCCSFYPFSKN